MAGISAAAAKGSATSLAGKNQIGERVRRGLVENVSFGSSASSEAFAANKVVGARSALSPEADSADQSPTMSKRSTSNLNGAASNRSSKQVAKVILDID